jgi:hypothetical protein
MNENIKIKIDITAEFWDKLPMVDVILDNKLIHQHVIDQKKYVILHNIELELGKSHHLKLKRYNKTDDQCKIIDGEKKDQYIILDRVALDGIDVENLIWSRSWYEPDYPSIWKKEQEQSGIVLEKKIIGETWLSHNGEWNFEFFSPFYRFVINQFE